MIKGLLNLVERHIEKAALALCGLFLLAMAGLYLVRSPNSVKYNNQEVSPGELDAAILRNAQDLKSRVDNAKDQGGELPRYSQWLAEQHQRGLFAAVDPSAPALPRSLRLAGTFGTPNEVPGLKESEESERDIVVVTPLPPDPPKVRTGRSMARRIQATLDDEPSAQTPGDEELEPTEFPWVTIAAYFDKKAQQYEMTNAGYAPYRSKVYLVGVDAQRQELLASGEFSDWAPVPTSKATPRTNLQNPVFDDESGLIINKNEMQRGFTLVQQRQALLMQPPFYDVDTGDDWDIPPLEGFEPEEEDAEVKEPRERRQQPEQRQPVRQTTPPPGRGMMGGGRSGMMGGGSTGMMGGGAVTPTEPRSGQRDQSDARRRQEERRRATQDLGEAKRAFLKKEYDRARDLARSVIGNDNARRSDVASAEKLVDRAERKVSKQGGTVGRPITGPTGMLEPTGMMGGGRMPSRTAARSTRDDAQPLITHPENPQKPAIWFHDDSVESGKTYRYRLRVKLWNRYVGGTKALRSAEDAKKCVLVGDWSLPSEPVTVTPSTHFFLKGPRTGQQVAGVEVWKWLEGAWIKETFDVSVGDVIGGPRKVKILEWDEEDRQIRREVDFTTGAIVLDLRFDEPTKVRLPKPKGGFRYSESPSLVMVYLDPADGQVKEKVQAFDKYDPLLQKLKDQEF